VAEQTVDRVVEQAVVVVGPAVAAEPAVVAEPAAVAGQVVARVVGPEAAPLQLHKEGSHMCPGCSFRQSRTREG
jgi:hypothetical protein